MTKYQGKIVKERNSGKLIILFNCFSLFFFALVCFVSNSFAQTQEQLDYYAERIKFGTEDVKRNALFDLRNFETEAASRSALPALRDSSEIVRATATASVIYLPKDESAQALLPLLNEKSEFVRRETAYALGKTKNWNVADNLIAIIQKDKKQSVRDAAAVSLGIIANPIAVTTLSNILSKKPKKEEEFFRRAAARSIGQIAEVILQKQLSFATPESFLPLKYKTFRDINYDLAEKFPIFNPVIPVLTNSLQNPKEFEDVRREAAFALGSIGNETSIAILQANLNSEDYYLAEICEEALLKIK